MIPSTITATTMRTKASPQRRVRVGTDSVGSHPHDALNTRRSASILAGLKKEVNAATRPWHSPVAISQAADTSKPFFKFSYQCVKPLQVTLRVVPRRSLC